MRDIKRIDKVLKEISRAWKKNPDLRLMQLLVNCRYHNGDDMYFLEDSAMVARIKDTYEV